DYEDAKAYLLSGKLTEDVLIQEFLSGDEYGMEVHGSKGNYIISPPFRIFNTAEGQLNDPLGATTLKYGPILDEKFKVEELRKELLRLAEVMEFSGIMEVDLVLADGLWYILEINNRWSGLTTLITASQERLPYDVYMDQYEPGTVDLNDTKKLKFACQFKMPGADLRTLARIASEESVISVIQYEVRMPGQDPYFFNDAVTGGYESMEALLTGFEKLQQKYPEQISKELVDALIQKEGV
ncbi:MAG: ATP-grasp domain-containing protein, partial [Anaerovibrio sp.]|uniref:ATP-grasp domain-containing protein n=1 Tax=Anaerovibrio sp. TaxID=1872532 RepID=UPI0025E83986